MGSMPEKTGLSPMWDTDRMDGLGEKMTHVFELQFPDKKSKILSISHLFLRVVGSKETRLIQGRKFSKQKNLLKCKLFY